MVGMAEVRVTRAPDALLMALGLGSCIGLCAYDAQAQVAGLAHIVLPDSNGNEAGAGKFADTAIPFLISEMERLGASGGRIRAALTGGAQLFVSAPGETRLDIGPRNAAAVLSELKKRGIPVMATDIGGNAGRTVQLSGAGRVSVRTIGQGMRELAALGQQAADAPRRETPRDGRPAPKPVCAAGRRRNATVRGE